MDHASGLTRASHPLSSRNRQKSETETAGPSRRIRIAIAGIGNCAGSLVEGLAYYRAHPEIQAGLLFPTLCGYRVQDVEVAAAFDISRQKVGRPLSEAIYQEPNNFVRIPGVRVDCDTPVLRGPTLDGNPPHLASIIEESERAVDEASSILKRNRVEVLINFLPTGSIEAAEFYAQAALAGGCAFINCMPSVIAQRPDFQSAFAKQGLPLLGDDIKSQVGTTILHRALLHMLEMRGATLDSTSQINIGGNTDFANFVYRAGTKLTSKNKSLARYVDQGQCHIGHHFDRTRGPYKHAIIEIAARVFAGSPVKISVRLESDDKPNSVGSVLDLVRIARGAMDRKLGGVLNEACAFYMKSAPVPMDDADALRLVRRRWGDRRLNGDAADAVAGL
jgi:myo-inositol-1-phosphate synthase